MKTTLTFLFVLFTWAALPGQGDCPSKSTRKHLHGNTIRTTIHNNGGLFFGLADEELFLVPYDISNPVGTIFISNLWLGALDPEGNEQFAAPDYYWAENQLEYYPGPLDENGEADSLTCVRWNRIWEVRGADIEAHIADWNDNNTIDHLISSILLWPGKGNPFFPIYHGFELPDTPAGLAPFEDVDGDGIYNPLQGDHPMVEGIEVIPSHMLWCIFNDKGNVHQESGGAPMGVEVQLTSWALSCEDNPLLNETIFLTYKVVNRSGEWKHKMRAGMMSYFALGCNSDDYFGCYPEGHSFYVYNKDNTDGNAYCNKYGLNPPVQSATFLNRELVAFLPIQTQVGFGGCPFQNPFSEGKPFNFLQGLTYYGTSLGEGSVYFGGTLQDTAFLFPDLPTLPGGFSMYQQAQQGPYPFGCFRKSLGVADVGDLGPDSLFRFDLAWTYHRKEGLNHIQNTEFMAGRVMQLRQDYQSGFEGFCTPLSTGCSPNCVYPGDANADGIANYEDLLAIGLAMGQQGAAREENMLYWGPLPADPWADDFFWGPNHHHADCNGDGQVDAMDIELITLNYGKTRPGYEHEHTFPLGDQLKAVANSYPGVGRLDSLQPGDPVSIQVLLQNLPEDIYGLSFSMVWDPAWVRVLIAGGTCSAYPEYCQSYFKQSENYPPSPPIDFSITRTHLDSVLKEGSVLGLYVKIPNELPGPPPPDGIRFRFRDVVALRADGSEVPIGAEDIVLTLAPPSATREAGIWAGVRLSPNPVSDVLYLSGLPAGRVEWEWFDAQGISRGKGATESPELQLSVGFLAEGLYFLHLQHASGTMTSRVVISR